MVNGYEFDELTANDVFDEVDGVVTGVLNLAKDEHLAKGERVVDWLVGEVPSVIFPGCTCSPVDHRGV